MHVHDDNVVDFKKIFSIMLDHFRKLNPLKISCYYGSYVVYQFEAFAEFANEVAIYKGTFKTNHMARGY